MFKVLKRRWKYLTAKLSGEFEERADPKVQLEQAIGEAQDQHRRLVEQAASVIANQKQTELQLTRAMDDLGKLHSSTEQALKMAQDAEKSGDAQKTAEYNQTAEAFANRLIATEHRVSDLKTMSLQSAQASDKAKVAVQQNSAALQEKLAERQKLLSQLDQAKMQEQLNSAMTNLSTTVGQDTPTLEQVRDKIEGRYAKAIGTSELSGQSVESRMLEVQQAAIGTEAKSKLDEIRQQMGLPSGDTSAGQLGTSTTSASSEYEAAEADDAEEPSGAS